MATIHYDELVRILRKNKDWGAANDVDPFEALYIDFTKKGSHLSGSSTTFKTTNELTIALNITKEGDVIGIEII